MTQILRPLTLDFAVFADRVEQEQGRKLSLVGIYHQLEAPRFPHPADLQVGGHFRVESWAQGEYPIVVSFRRAQASFCYREQGHIRVPELPHGGGYPSYICWKHHLTGFTLPAPGEYYLELLDGELEGPPARLGQVRLSVVASDSGFRPRTSA